MSPQDLEATYFVLLVQMRGFSVRAAAIASRGLVARDAAERWWDHNN